MTNFVIAELDKEFELKAATKIKDTPQGALPTPKTKETPKKAIHTPKK